MVIIKHSSFRKLSVQKRKNFFIQSIVAANPERGYVIRNRRENMT